MTVDGGGGVASAAKAVLATEPEASAAPRGMEPAARGERHGAAGAGLHVVAGLSRDHGPLDAAHGGANSGGQGLKLLSLGELLTQSIPPRKALLWPWLREGEACLLWAPTGAGKSLFALSVALAVAGGGEFLGWKAGDPGADREPRRVLYVDGEMPLGDIQDRARMLLGRCRGLIASVRLVV